MTEQPTHVWSDVPLPFRVRHVSAGEDATTLQETLAVRRGWVRRAWLQQVGPCAGWPERRFRAAAAASNGQIVGSSKGYCLTRLASVEDVAHAERQLHSQARAMLRRVIQIRRARNLG